MNASTEWKVLGTVTECTISGHVAIGLDQLGPVAYVDRQHVPILLAAPALLHAAKEALAALTCNLNDEVQGDFDLASGYGLDDEVKWLAEAIQQAGGGAR